MSFENGKTNISKMLSEHEHVDGIFINTDLVAVGAIAELNNRGIKVPEDIAIVGFSNWFMSSVISPKLTTINQPGFDMGKQSFKLLYKEIKASKKNNPLVPKTVVLDTDLIIRETTSSTR